MNEYKEDIKHLIDKIEETHPNPYLLYEKELFYKNLEELLNKELKPEEFKYKLATIIAKLGEPHTYISFKRTFVFEIKLISDKVYIIHDYRNKDSKYLYKEIKSINGVDIKDIIPLVINVIPSKNQEWHKAMLQQNLLSKEVLTSLNIVQDGKYLIKLNDGIIIDSDKELNKEVVNKIKTFEQKSLLNDTFYIKYSKCYNSFPNEIENFFVEVVENIKNYNLKNIIIDLRGNTGGKSSHFTNFSKFLKENFKDVNYYTLIDEYVFSSGIWALHEMKEMGSIIIGTPPGSIRDMFGEAKRFELPKSLIEVCCSTAYYKYEKDEFVKYDENNINEVDEYLFEHYEPDILVEPTIEDYKEGNDACLSKVLELIQSHMIGGK